MTAEGLAALQAELEQLETVARREIAERIKTAREWGDLKENAEYHDAKNDQAFLETKILRLTERLRNAQVVRGGTPGEVRVGSEVELRDESSGKTLAYKIVGSTEADIAQGRLSVESPIGRATVGKRSGDAFEVETPRGRKRYAVLNVA